MRRWSSLLRATLLPWLLTSVTPVNAGPITTNTALPVHDGEVVVRVQTKLTRATDDPSVANRELTIWAIPTVVVYGATERLTLLGVFPYLEKHLRVQTANGRRTRGDSGIGDIRFLARYTVGQWDKPRETVRLAPFIGLEAPTGEDGKEDELGRLPPGLQLGSGSWRGIFGTIFTWQRLAWEFDASASHRLNAGARDFEPGDETRFDLSFQYRLSPFELTSGVPSFLYAVAESNLVWQERDRLSGARDGNSGGLTWFLSPGLQYVTERFILEAAVQLPALQDLNGKALGSDAIVAGGFRTNF